MDKSSTEVREQKKIPYRKIIFIAGAVLLITIFVVFLIYVFLAPINDYKINIISVVSGKGLNGVKVTLTSSKNLQITGTTANGFLTIQNLPQDRYTISVSQPGFEEVSTSITVGRFSKQPVLKLYPNIDVVYLDIAGNIVRQTMSGNKTTILTAIDIPKFVRGSFKHSLLYPQGAFLQNFDNQNDLYFVEYKPGTVVKQMINEGIQLAFADGYLVWSKKNSLFFITKTEQYTKTYFDIWEDAIHYPQQEEDRNSILVYRSIYDDTNSSGAISNLTVSPNGETLAFEKDIKLLEHSVMTLPSYAAVIFNGKPTYETTIKETQSGWWHKDIRNIRFIDNTYFQYTTVNDTSPFVKEETESILLGSATKFTASLLFSKDDFPQDKNFSTGIIMPDINTYYVYSDGDKELYKINLLTKEATGIFKGIIVSPIHKIENYLFFTVLENDKRYIEIKAIDSDSPSLKITGEIDSFEDVLDTKAVKKP